MGGEGPTGKVDTELPLGESEPGDQFGSTLAVGYLDDDASADLAVGAYCDRVGEALCAGAVYVFRGGSLLLGWRTLTQAGLGADEAGDHFGYAIGAIHFDDQPGDDLIIGAPGEDIGDPVREDVGWAFVFAVAGDDLVPFATFSQSGIDDDGAGDRFGAAIAVHPPSLTFSVGAPGETEQGLAATGALYTFSFTLQALSWTHHARYTLDDLGGPLKAGAELGAASALTCSAGHHFTFVGAPREGRTRIGVFSYDGDVAAPLEPSLPNPVLLP